MSYCNWFGELLWAPAALSVQLAALNLRWMDAAMSSEHDTALLILQPRAGLQDVLPWDIGVQRAFGGSGREDGLLGHLGARVRPATPTPLAEGRITGDRGKERPLPQCDVRSDVFDVHRCV